MLFDPKTNFGFYFNLLPQALTGCNTWISWCLFLSFFIGLCLYVEACLGDFHAHINEICSPYQDECDENGEKDVQMDETAFRKNETILNETIEMHVELTR